MLNASTEACTLTPARSHIHIHTVTCTLGKNILNLFSCWSFVMSVVVVSCFASVCEVKQPERDYETHSVLWAPSCESCVGNIYF